jgi:hypothetical protein
MDDSKGLTLSEMALIDVCDYAAAAFFSCSKFYCIISKLHHGTVRLDYTDHIVLNDDAAAMADFIITASKHGLKQMAIMIHDA